MAYFAALITLSSGFLFCLSEFGCLDMGLMGIDGIGVGASHGY
jgi:hypothetical protein